MKQVVIFFVAVFGFTLCAAAQSPQYVAAMEQGLKQIREAQSSEAFLAAANHFERIAVAEKQDWLAAYYQSYCQMMMAMVAMQQGELSRLNGLLDKAQAALDRARQAAGEHSEIEALQGLIYTGRIWPDPQSGGPTYSPMAHGAFEKAKALDANNPRAYYLQGQLVLFTPPFWGGGPQGALPLLEQAKEKFAVHAPASALHPQWGAQQNEGLIGKAKAGN